ncbi:hypothetical protein ZWY2020_043517 [Hordeum vulgare]|nr:hypothetical protein ZWY2020_043517 [Hordeum vulgare]
MDVSGGHDPDEMEGLFYHMLSWTQNVLPYPSISIDGRLFALHESTYAPLVVLIIHDNIHYIPSSDPSLLRHDSVEHITRLSDVLLSNIVTCLPVKEATCNAALSRCWRGVRVTAIARADAGCISFAISRVHAMHPGPFRFIHLTSCYMEELHGLLTRYSTFILPSTFFCMTTLTCLYLGVWKFPDTVDVKRATYFPNLRELGLYTILMESKDFDFLLDNSPMIETLCVKSNLFKLNLRLVRQSIRCVKIIMSFFGEIYVVDTLFLERLIISRGWTNDGVCNKVNIGHATKFHSLGYLDSGNHVLEFSNTVIKVRAKVIPSTMIPSVGILALNVCCGVHNYGKMILTILKCFLNVEMLHIIKLVNPLASTTMSSGTIKCISSCIKQLVFHDFQGGRNELDFLKFFFKSVFTSMEDMLSKMKPLGSMKWASADSSIMVSPQGGSIWKFNKASEFSICDPFTKN